MEYILAAIVGAIVVLGIIGLVLLFAIKAPEKVFYTVGAIILLLVLSPFFAVIGGLIIDAIFGTHIITYRAQ